MHTLLHLLSHSLLDALKLIPFLFLTYLAMEYLEHKAGGAAERVLKRSGQFGSLLGSALGIIPQCGFSSAAAGLYSARVISLGTLISVFLSTSDEMMPIFISNGASLTLMLKVLASKFVIALIAGTAVDLIIRAVYRKRGIDQSARIEDLCERDHCHCHGSLLRSAIVHTAKIAVFIFVFTFILNCAVEFIGESVIASVVLNKPILANVLAALVGIIPNCASSVIITELFIEGVIPAGAMLSGLLVNSGVALAVLFRSNRPRKNTWAIVGLLLAISIVVGIIVDITPISSWLAI